MRISTGVSRNKALYDCKGVLANMSASTAAKIKIMPPADSSLKKLEMYVS